MREISARTLTSPKVLRGMHRGDAGSVYVYVMTAKAKKAKPRTGDRMWTQLQLTQVNVHRTDVNLGHQRVHNKIK